MRDKINQVLVGTPEFDDRAKCGSSTAESRSYEDGLPVSSGRGVAVAGGSLDLVDGCRARKCLIRKKW